MSAYRRDFDETNYVYFLIKDHKLLQKYSEVWQKLKIILRKNLIVSLYTMINI